MEYFPYETIDYASPVSFILLRRTKLSFSFSVSTAILTQLRAVAHLLDSKFQNYFLLFVSVRPSSTNFDAENMYIIVKNEEDD